MVSKEASSKIVRMREEGRFVRDIASEVGCCKKTVYRTLELAGAI